MVRKLTQTALSILLVGLLGCEAEPPNSPRSEPCNGVDDDSDGLVDEGNQCRPGDIGACNGSQVKACSAACLWGACGGSCILGSTVSCGNCGVQVCLETGWSTCQDEGECQAGSTRACAEGQQFCTTSCQWDACSSTSCSVGALEACGNCGTRSCSAGRWGACLSQGECSVGDRQQCSAQNLKSCDDQCTWSTCDDGRCQTGETEACGRCGVRTCVNGIFGACENEGVCSLGEFEACGNNGLRSCTDACEFGTCMNEGQCTAGATRDCGLCGSQTCQADGSYGECEGVGVCTPGESVSCGFGGMQICGAACTFGECTGAGECMAGATESCGDCGVRICGNDNMWGLCSGEGECTAAEVEACGNGGTRTCSAACAWGMCMGEMSECTTGATRNCGNCGTQQCTSGSWGTCNGSGPCMQGETGSCGTSGTRSCSSTCQWGTCSEQTTGLNFESFRRVTVPGSMDFNVTDFTIELRLRAGVGQEDTAPAFGIWWQENSLVTQELGFGITKSTVSGQAGGLYLILSNTVRRPGSSPDLRDGQWHQVAVTRSGGTLRFFVDGSDVGTSSWNTNAIDIHDGVLTMGISALSSFRGDLQNVRFWNVARTPSQIATDNPSGAPTQRVGLIAHWPLDEGVGQTVNDATGSHPGFLGNSSAPDNFDAFWLVL